MVHPLVVGPAYPTARTESGRKHFDARAEKRRCVDVPSSAPVDVDPGTVLDDDFYSKKNCNLLLHSVGGLSSCVRKLEERLAATEMELARSQKDLHACKISFTTLKDEPVLLKFYTGVSVETFGRVKTVLRKSPEGMDYSGTKKGDHEGKGIP